MANIFYRYLRLIMHKFYFWNNIASVLAFVMLAYVVILKFVIEDKQKNFYTLLAVGVLLVVAFIFTQVMKSRAKNKHHKSVK